MTTTSSAERPQDNATERNQIRGSSLLLGGRVLSLGINCLTQVLIVRYLSTTAYGAWAYCLSVVIACEAFSALSLEQSLARFVPIYYERRQLARLLGAVVLSLGVMATVAALFIVPFYAFTGPVSRLVRDPQALGLLLILVFLIPIESTDYLFEGLLASFDSARAIFVRKYLLGPCLKIAAILVIRSASLNVRWLAIAYVFAAAVGLSFYFGNLGKVLRERGLLRRELFRHIDIPFRELLGFTLPVMTTTMVSVLNQSVAAMLLGFFRDTSQVAFYRAVYPVATLNQVVFGAFLVLFTPSAAKLFARGDSAGVQRLYWRNAVWMGALSFPIFVATCGFAAPVVHLLFGSRYAASAAVLMLIATGYFFSVAIGFNAQALQVVGKTRYIAAVNVSAIVFNVIANMLVIRRYGAVGAAAVTLCTIVLQNVLNQVALWKLGIRWPEKRYWTFFGLLIVASAAVIGLHFFARTHLLASILIAAPLAALIVFVGLAELDLHETFPEAQNIPLLRTLCARRLSPRYLLMKALDAVVTARCQPATWKHNMRSVLHPNSPHYERVGSLIRLLRRCCPLPVRAAERMMLRTDELPFRSTDIEPVAFGFSVTVFRVRIDESDCALKVFRDSLGYGLDEALSVVHDARTQYERVVAIYGGELVLPLSFLVLKSPVLGATAAAAVQPFVNCSYKDLFAYRDSEILALAREHTSLRESFVHFARSTIASCNAANFCLDILGPHNVVVLAQDAPRLAIMDTGAFDLRVIKEKFPERMEKMQAQLRRLESLLGAIEKSPAPAVRDVPAVPALNPIRSGLLFRY